MNAELTRCLVFAIKILILYRILVGEKKLSDLPYFFLDLRGCILPSSELIKTRVKLIYETNNPQTKAITRNINNFHLQFSTYKKTEQKLIESTTNKN